ncbi:MAG: Wzz/FepE/Etk N-terminal domain-containing protein [Candidatus Falkowbacteria bacterium]
MEYKQFVNLVKKRKLTVFSITVMFLIVVSLLTFLQPLRYSATSTLLVVQNYGPNTDAYNVSRSNQFLSNLLAQVVYSDSFYGKVMESGYNINKSLFSADINKRKKEWQNMVYTRAIADTGMITLKTYHQDKATADKINQAIAYTLMTKHSQYHGLSDNVKIKVINDSTLSDWPVKPNIALNLILGLISGLAASLYFIYLFPNKQLSLKIDILRKASVDEPLADQIEPEPLLDEALVWPPVQPEAGPVLAYNSIENVEENYNAEPDIEHDIEETEDEFESYFKGNINNVIQR